MRPDPRSVRKRVDIKDPCGASLGVFAGSGRWPGAGGRTKPLGATADHGRRPEPGFPIPWSGALRAAAWGAGPSCASAFGGRSQVGARDAARAPWPHITGARAPPGGREPACCLERDQRPGLRAPRAGRGAHGPQGTAIAGGFPRGCPGLSEGFSRLPAGCPPGGKAAWGKEVSPRLSGEREAGAHWPQEGPCRRCIGSHRVIGFSRTLFLAGELGERRGVYTISYLVKRKERIKCTWNRQGRLGCSLKGAGPDHKGACVGAQWFSPGATPHLRAVGGLPSCLPFCYPQALRAAVCVCVCVCVVHMCSHTCARECAWPV